VAPETGVGALGAFRDADERLVAAAVGVVLAGAVAVFADRIDPLGLPGPAVRVVLEGLDLVLVAARAEAVRRRGGLLRLRRRRQRQARRQPDEEQERQQQEDAAG
jgi:hypothetical protein